MLFAYPERPHIRKHGPSGYEDYRSYKDWLRDEFTFRCVYCLERERWYPSGQDAFAVEHVLPKGVPEYRHLECDYENLVYACNRCNAAKRQEVILDPCSQPFAEHLSVAEDGQIEGRTLQGKDLVDILGLNLEGARGVRVMYLRLLALQAKYPDDPEVQALCQQAFGFPEDLPDLIKLRPPGNQRPEGTENCYHRQRELGKLTPTYF
jgi:hypothetical protein